MQSALLVSARDAMKKIEPARPNLRLLMPWAALLLGVLFSLVLQGLVVDDVFYSGDGGMKALLVKQFAEGGWHADLRLDAPSWVRAAWQDGLFPFAPPFAYPVDQRWYVQYPVPFPALSTPFYAAFGFRGLHVLPLLSVWALWLGFLTTCHRLEVGPGPTAVALAGMIFASYLTAYSAMFWEHTLAVALAFGGVAMSLPDSPRGVNARRAVAGGLLLGVAVCLRPECAGVLAGSVLALVLARAPVVTWLGHTAGGAAVIAGFLLFNKVAYGIFLGVHSLQSVDRSELHMRLLPAYRIGLDLTRDLAWACPLLVLIVAVLLLSWPWRPLRPDRPQRALWIALGAFLLIAPFVLPNLGGKQFGPRYLLPAVPLVCLIAATQLGALRAEGRRSARVVVGTAVVAALAVGVYFGAVQGTRVLHHNYRHRVRPVLDALRASDAPVVAVWHQAMAQELVAAFDEKAFFRVRNQEEIELLADRMLEQNLDHFLWILWDDPGVRVGKLPTSTVLMSEPRAIGRYLVFDAKLVTE